MLLCAQFFDADSDVLSRTANGRASERGLQRLLELTCDWCFALDAAVRLAHVEERCLADPASPVSDWLGHPPWKWHGVSADSPDLARLRAALEAQAPFRDLECALRDRRGHQRYLSFSAEPVFDGAGRFAGYCGAARDVTARRRAEALAALEHAVTRSLAEADTSRNVLQAVMRIICESENWETAGFFRAEDELGTTRLIAGWSGPGMAQAAAEYYRQTVDRVIPPGGMLSKVIAEGKPLWVEEMKEGQTTWSQRVRHTGERATFFVPLRVDGLVHGVFAFASREIREPDEPLLCTLGVIGDQVGQFLKRKHAEQVLRESEARFRALTGLSSDWYWESDASFRLTRIEGRDVEAAEAGHGQGAIGKCRWETGLAMDDPAGWDEHRAQLETHLPFRDVVMVRRGPGDSCRYIAVSGEPVHDARGVFLGYRGVGRDISERKVAENRIRHLASHDGLTGLPNRVMFAELLGLAVHDAQRQGSTPAVLFIDLDRFKAINDLLGHDAGDALLREMGQRLKDCLRSSDMLSRLGGDEFVVLVRDVDSAQGAATIARKLLSAASQPFALHGRQYAVSASIGISMYGVDAHDEQELVRNADAAMYAAKQDGKNGFRFYSPEVAMRSHRRPAMESRLRDALERGELGVHYQPRFDLRSRRLLGAEALLRWHNGELGDVPPSEFIPIAEESGLIVPIGKWVLREACLQAVAWDREGFAPLMLSVNLSARQFADRSLVADIAFVLRETGLPARRLELEITEGTVVQDVDRAVRLLDELKGLGLRLAIDDFGTGYSSLGQLKRFPIDTLKVDRSFIRDLPNDAEDAAITHAIIAMGKSLGMTVVAEGVETKEQEAFLRSRGCDEVQGFLMGRPALAEDFVRAYLLSPFVGGPPARVGRAQEKRRIAAVTSV